MIVLCLAFTALFARRLNDLAPGSMSDWFFIGLGASVAACVSLLWLQIAILERFGRGDSARGVLRALWWATVAFAFAGSSWLYGVELPEAIQFLGAGFGVALFISGIPVWIALRRQELEATS
jgi:hypothetical protein